MPSHCQAVNFYKRETKDPGEKHLKTNSNNRSTEYSNYNVTHKQWGQICGLCSECQASGAPS